MARTLATRRFGARAMTASLNAGRLATDGYARVTEFSALQNVFATGGAIAYWAFHRTLGATGTSNTIMIKGAPVSTSGGWSLTQSSGIMKRLNVGFSTTVGNFRLGDTFAAVVGRWYFSFVWYDGSNVTNLPVYYSGQKYGILTKATTSASTTPVGTIVTDAGSDLYIGNDSTGATACDANLTGIKIYKGAEPTLAEVQTLFQFGTDPASLTKVEEWADGTTSFLSKSGSNNGALTAPTTVNGFIPFTSRTLRT